MVYVILDKSYLDAASPEQIKFLCANHTVLMVDTLFYELTRTKEPSMSIWTRNMLLWLPWLALWRATIRIYMKGLYLSARLAVCYLPLKARSVWTKSEHLGVFRRK